MAKISTTDSSPDTEHRTPNTQDPPFTWADLHIWRPLVVRSLQLLFLLLGPVRSHGAYRVPKEGGVLIVGNHLADCDPPVVQIACPRPIRFMAKSDLWDIKWLRRFITWAGAFPIVRGEPDRAALKRAVDLLARGEAVCIFPEGELSESGELLPIKPGVALIIRMAGVPVICCGIRGSSRVMPYGTLIPRPSWHSIDVTWGEPRSFDKKATTEEIVAWIEGQLKELTTP